LAESGQSRRANPQGMTNDSQDRRPVSIGRLSAETGVSTERLRIWERRYGNPRPVRLPSGHRRYSWEQVRRLRRVAELIARGERPGELLRLSPEELEARFDASEPPDERFDELDALLDAATRLDAEALASGLRELADELELVEFLEGRVTPLMHAIGTRWADGTLDVRHEHFAVRVVSKLLDDLGPATSGQAGTAVLATLPTERHGLALRMLGLLCRQEDFRVSELEVDLPTREIQAAARDLDAALVAVSVSSARHLHDSFRDLRDLRERLPEGCPLLVGGAGATRGQRGPRGVRVFRDLHDFRSWLVRTRSSASNGAGQSTEDVA
jgi:DNA-binding transcriptional MerR regulator